MLALHCGAAWPQAPEPEVVRTGDAIHFNGRIDAASAARFHALLQEGGVRRLVITSGGGLVAPALDMAEAIHAQGLDLEVPSACLSSCANYLFPAARRKVLGWPGAVAWHGNMSHVLYLHQTGQGQWSEPAMEEARQLAVREQALFRRLGVDGFVCWVGKIAPHDVPGFYALTPEDLAGFGIGGVTVQAIGRPPDGEAVAFARMDWARLPAHRPAVSYAAPALKP